MPEMMMPGMSGPAPLPYGGENPADIEAMLTDALRQIVTLAQENGLDPQMLLAKAGASGPASPKAPPPPLPNPTSGMAAMPPLPPEMPMMG